MDENDYSPRATSIDDCDHRPSSFQMNLTESEGGDDQGFKAHISRIPTKFTEETVLRILLEKMNIPENNIARVELVYPRKDAQSGNETEDDVPGATQRGGGNCDSGVEGIQRDVPKEHRGFGFVTFSSYELLERALKLETFKGGRNVSSRRQHTMYLRPYAAIDRKSSKNHNSTITSDDSVTGHDVCYLWSHHRCPYGDKCKFRHVGEGSCVVIPGKADGESLRGQTKKKKGKCFAYKKGKCTKGAECPFSHDFDQKPEVKMASTVEKSISIGGNEKEEAATCAYLSVNLLPKSEKDCINWKTKGSCRKGAKCPYRHDPELQAKALKKRQRTNMELDLLVDDADGTKQRNKEKQPLSVRVFGLNYETTEQDVREFFQDCGRIHDLSFPLFEDSGRSKGYCAVWFSSPNAVAMAVELDGKELHGRWLRIQSGKMMKQWEELHTPSGVSGSVQRKRFKHGIEATAPSLAVE